MSLNGLDGAAVAEAHQAVLVDAGGWYVVFAGDWMKGLVLTSLDQVPAQICQSRHSRTAAEGHRRRAGSERCD